MSREKDGVPFVFLAGRNRIGQHNEWILWSNYIVMKTKHLKIQDSTIQQMKHVLVNLVDHPISVQGHEGAFFCGHEHKGFQVLLGDSAPKSILHKFQCRKNSLTGHLSS